MFVGLVTALTVLGRDAAPAADQLKLIVLDLPQEAAST